MCMCVPVSAAYQAAPAPGVTPVRLAVKTGAILPDRVVGGGGVVVVVVRGGGG